MPPDLRRKCLAILSKICSHHGLIPRSIQIPLCYDRTEIPIYEGGFAQIWKGEHEGTEVAVKVLKVAINSDFAGIKKVGFPIHQRAQVDPFVPTAQSFCREVMSWKALRHQNVLSLLGVMMNDRELVMVSEWMTNGHIMEFTKTHRDANRFKLVGFCSTADCTCC